MTISSLESIPEFWSDEKDVPFFTIVAGPFSATFTYGAGVLLADNADADVADQPMAGKRPTNQSVFVDTPSAWASRTAADGAQR